MLPEGLENNGPMIALWMRVINEGHDLSVHEVVRRSHFGLPFSRVAV